MKLRIKGNSVRLRLSQPEVEAFLEYGSISDVLELPDQPLVYGLEKCSSDQLNVTRRAGAIRIGLPGPKMDKWRSDDCVGFSEEVILGEKNIRITVEKDFQCLKPRAHEDESQLFPNPEAG